MTDSPLEKKPGSPARPPATAEADRDAELSVRASDADRDRVADILREALAQGRLDAEEHAERIGAVYSAKTVGELQPLVRDLPEGRGAEPVRHQGRPGPGTYAPGPHGAEAYGGYAGHPADSPKENLVAIFSGSVRKGRWCVPPKINAFACFGGVEIDLTEAVFPQQHIVINATAIFGGVQIRVPENVTLRQKGTGIFGGFDVRASESDEPEAPVVLVRGAAVFGGVDARPKRGKRLRDLRERFRKQL